MTAFILFSRIGKPTDAVSSVPASSSGSSNSYDGDDAQCFFQEWRVAEDRYSEVIQNNGQLEIRLGSSKRPLMWLKRRPAPFEHDWLSLTPR